MGGELPHPGLDDVGCTPLPPPPAQFTVGVLHAHGLFGVPLDEALAVLHYYFAALGGSLQAQVR